MANEDNPYIEDIKKFTNDNIKLFFAPKNSIMGAIRNISVDNARGEYIAQWDDDNVHHANRLTAQYNHVKIFDKQACFLRRVLVHDIITGDKGITKPGRGIESTIVALKKDLPRYDNNTQYAEDLPARIFFQSNGKSATLDEPQLYIYNIHNNNSCKYQHLRSMIDTII